MTQHSGSCLCGAVTFEVSGDLPGADACHCGMCRKISGHYFASANVKRAALTIQGEDKVTWYTSSDKVRRGFCARCGSTLFWDPLSRDWLAIAMGAFDTPTLTRLTEHIFVAEKGDYYDIADGVTQFEKWPPRAAPGD
jgi:hypothetical protein